MNLHILECHSREMPGWNSSIGQLFGECLLCVYCCLSPEDILMGGKEESCFLLEGKVQWGNQSIINYRIKCEVAPMTSVIDEATVVLRVYLMFIDKSGPHQGDQDRLPGGSTN